jgi:Peptidase family M50
MSIGTINFLPIPGLDGGHLFIYIIESIIRRPASRYRKPVSRYRKPVSRYRKPVSRNCKPVYRNPKADVPRLVRGIQLTAAT